MYKIVLIRHGESQYNKLNKFTGWTDVALSPRGVKQAKEAGQVLKKAGYSFDLVFENCLQRSRKTTTLVLKELKNKKVEVLDDWHLNERHYGNLQGLNKAETLKKFGEKQFMLWRRSYSVRPPVISSKNPTYSTIKNNPLYKGIKIPKSESLVDVVKRVVPFWKQEIVPQIKANKQVLISASGNSLRALIKHLDKISNSEIVKFNVPTGVPLVYELDNKLKPIRHYYLGDQKKIQALIEEVKNQGKK